MAAQLGETACRYRLTTEGGEGGEGGGRGGRWRRGERGGDGGGEGVREGGREIKNSTPKVQKV